MNLVGDFADTDPKPVWDFTCRWGAHRIQDVRLAVSCCVLEHLLQYHFDAYFPRVRALAKSNARFAWTVLMCGKFGQSEIPANARRLARLQSDVRGWHGPRLR